ncbi:MAG: TfoX/Sxy family protein [Thermoflexales bacterium]|nr:TfoX/Sxy family protein [Thermoflexales bacterium]
MAYDAKLAERIRATLNAVPDVRAGLVEKKMFGGIGYMLRGNMVCGILGDEFIARFAVAEHEAMLKKPGTRPFGPAGRTMRGWAYVHGDAVRSGPALKAWVDRCIAYCVTLPPKP